MSDKELVIIEKMDIAKIFSGGDALDQLLEKIKKEVMSVVPDLTTAQGRKDIASNAYRVSQSKTALDKEAVKLVTDWKSKAKAVDIERKKAKDCLDYLKAEAREPLTDWEKIDEKRQEDHRLGIELIWSLDKTHIDVDGEWTRLSLDQLKANLNQLGTVVMGEHWEEFAVEAIEAKESAIKTLKGHIESKEKHEAEQAELDRLRKEDEERKQKEHDEQIRKEAEEKVKREAEEKAAKEKEEADRKIKEAQEATEKAERDRIAAEEKAKIDAENAEKKRLSDIKETERKAEEEADRKEKERLDQEEAERKEADKKAANKRHRKTINNKALACFEKNGISNGQEIITLIASGKIEYVTINY